MKENKLIQETEANDLLTGVAAFLVVIFLIWLIGGFLFGPDPIDDTWYWEVLEGEFDFRVIPCDGEECHFDIEFQQEYYGNITFSVFTKSEFLNFQECENSSSIVDVNEKASHTFAQKLLPKGDYFLVVDFDHCSTDEAITSEKSIGTAHITTQSTDWI
jgi:hypothetical protein